MSELDVPNLDNVDWLPDNPVSDEANQQLLTESETLEQARITGYMSTYLDGEGCIQLACGSSPLRSIEYELSPKITVKTAKMAGLFDAEGCIQCSIGESESYSINHQMEQRLKLKQAEGAMVEVIFDEYCKHFDTEFTSISRPTQKSHWKPQIECTVRGLDNIQNFLAPLLPHLYEKQEEAYIMLRYIIPRMRKDEHLTKSGFVELMRYKELLDRDKPMGNDDRKYTVDYFEELWADELEAADEQASMSDYNTSDGKPEYE